VLRSLKEISGYRILATDGDIGKVNDFFFDDEIWALRYVVVETGSWLLGGRKVLLVPSVVEQPEWDTQTLPVRLNKDQVKDSPEIDSDKPVSRQAEMELHEHYNWMPYWVVPPYGITTPFAPKEMEREDVEEEKQGEKRVLEGERSNPHLRSVNEVTGYHIQALDGEIGHVEDFIADESNWFIRYMVVDTRNWLPGRKVLIPPDWIERVSWKDAKVTFDLPKELIKNSPEYDPAAPVNRQYEDILYDYYGRPKYWE
jgi:hypothetical protein